MTNREKRMWLDEGATLFGILLGMVIGSIYALFHVKDTGKTTRKNLSQFGAGSVDLAMDASLEDAKQQAHNRLDPTS